MHQSTTAALPTVLTSSLWNAGFGGELIPIQPGEKRCLMRAWTTMQVEPAMVEAWLKDGKGLGLRTRRFPAIDVDNISR